MSEKKPTVSVIVACYNVEDYIDLCFDSLVNQTFQDFEIVACDDCSTDGTYRKLLEWKDKDERIVVLQNSKNCYAAETRNRCIEVSKGEYLLIQDADDLSRNDRIEVLLKTLREEPEISFVSSQMAAFQTDPDSVSEIMDTKITYPKKKNFLWGLPFHHPATMFTRACLEAVNGYRVAEETRKGQDYDLFMRLYAEGYKGKNIPEALYYFRRDAANIRRRDFKARIWEYKIRKYGFKKLKMMPWAYIFTLKPFVAHLYQKIRFASVK